MCFGVAVRYDDIRRAPHGVRRGGSSSKASAEEAAREPAFHELVEPQPRELDRHRDSHVRLWFLLRRLCKKPPRSRAVPRHAVAAARVHLRHGERASGRASVGCSRVPREGGQRRLLRVANRSRRVGSAALAGKGHVVVPQRSRAPAGRQHGPRAGGTLQEPCCVDGGDVVAGFCGLCVPQQRAGRVAREVAIKTGPDVPRGPPCAGAGREELQSGLRVALRAAAAFRADGGEFESSVEMPIIRRRALVQLGRGLDVPLYTLPVVQAVRGVEERVAVCTQRSRGGEVGVGARGVLGEGVAVKVLVPETVQCFRRTIRRRCLVLQHRLAVVHGTAFASKQHGRVEASSLMAFEVSGAAEVQPRLPMVSFKASRAPVQQVARPDHGVQVAGLCAVELRPELGVFVAALPLWQFCHLFV
mmetsp:Transcript_4459/g.14089  ORF Transcript_4459/g.14089 Transcript_4459/m.14089 type:complete len:416 (+) Transcript_4459:1482-2729(+)